MSAELRRNFDQLSHAVDRLREALAEPTTNSLIIDGTIQRFEFTIELYWKVMKRLLAFEGIEAQTPRETLQHAYQAGWLSDETAWLDMLRDRNQTSHTYNEELARQIYDRIKLHFPELERTLPMLARRLPGRASPTG
ncbi:MAG: nucleotidyltransferase substrate binding protein [Deltaproteobacteria bacterium]|nr:nucleotidyltransferase substrate binding protein [Deltaproteobacteria bacterium]